MALLNELVIYIIKFIALGAIAVFGCILGAKSAKNKKNK